MAGITAWDIARGWVAKWVFVLANNSRLPTSTNAASCAAIWSKGPSLVYWRNITVKKAAGNGPWLQKVHVFGTRALTLLFASLVHDLFSWVLLSKTSSFEFPGPTVFCFPKAGNSCLAIPCSWGPVAMDGRGCIQKTRGANKSYREKLCEIKNALCWGRVFQKVQAKRSVEAPAAAAAKSPLPAAAPDSDSDWGDWKAQWRFLVCFSPRLTRITRGVFLCCAHSFQFITYGPHKAVAEVSKDKDPIRKGACGVQLVRKSIDVRFKRVESQMIWLSSDLRFNWFCCQLVWDSNDLVVNRCVLQMILVVCWFELQVMWLSIDFRFKWFGCRLIWDSNDLVVNRFEIQMSWLSIDLRFKWFGCQMIWGSSDLVVNWCVIQMILSNEAFVRDFLQNRSFDAQKRSFAARLPSKMKLWSSKTKLLCETSCKNEALKLKNEAFVRDILQKWSFEGQKRSISARLPSKMTCSPDTWPQNSNTF